MKQEKMANEVRSIPISCLVNEFDLLLDKLIKGQRKRAVTSLMSRTGIRAPVAEKQIDKWLKKIKQVKK